MSEDSKVVAAETVPAGALAPWEVADLPAPPQWGRRMLLSLIGPGIVLAGTSIGTGEWLFGPAVSAQYGASLFWLALTSILLQGFCNLIFMRYAIYCGEPINVGILRTWPGPRAWLTFFLVLDFTSIWPYNASNAAVPLAAALLGRLPHAGDMLLVKGLGIAIFLLAFVPLIFGGTVYRMLEKVMSFKLIVILGYLSIVAVTMVSLPVVWEVCTGFVRFGTVPLRPDTLIVDRHFSVRLPRDGVEYLAKGTWERSGDVTGELVVRSGQTTKKLNFTQPESFDAEAAAIRDHVFALTKPFANSQRFQLVVAESDLRMTAEGNVVDQHRFEPTKLTIIRDDVAKDYAQLDDVPEPQRSRLANHLEHEGLAYVNVVGYVRDNGRLPPLDWPVIVAFIAIAGAGGLTNTMFSNYARDKGWGMGHHVGAIPSAFGGLTVSLSHTGKVFPLTAENLARWRGWMKHIWRDQSIWIFASIIGMALPCMMSLEFIRNASVVGDRVAAMSAEGIAARYPSYASIFWFMTLFCGFLVLAPGQVSVGDQIARRWTDMIWNASARAKRMGEVRYVYYAILGAYAAFGLVTLIFFPAVQIARIAAVLQNIALGSTTLVSLYVTRRLVPRELHPGFILQFGVILCGLFFLAISTALLFI